MMTRSALAAAGVALSLLPAAVLAQSGDSTLPEPAPSEPIAPAAEPPAEPPAAPNPAAEPEATSGQSTNAEENLEPSEDDAESDELRTLRLAEVEMFGPSPGVTPLIELGRRFQFDAPPELTDGQDPPTVRPAEPDAARLAWLRDVALPDIPVRWEPEVLSYLEFYRDDPRGQSIARAWLERERRFGPMIRRVLESRQLPEDLVYVAMIESGFDPRARSNAGAVGMWQFVQRSGEEYGLSVDRWVDRRMDPEASTEAAAAYLNDLHRRFGGWELALAAYNMGYAALLRAMRKYNSNDYWTLARLEAGLPFETTFYVAKVMACAIVGRNPERFGLQDVEAEPLSFAKVEVPGGTRLMRAARAAGVEVTTLEELNPSLRRGRVPPGSAREIRIPEDSRERFAAQWSRSSPSRLTHDYVVRFGERIEDVAWRFQTTVDALGELNALEPGERVRAGTRLLVPAVEPRELPGEETPPIAAVPAFRFNYQDRDHLFYRVRGDERAEEVSSFFRVSLEELERWNHLDSGAALQPGMFLQLFVPAGFDSAAALVLRPEQVRVLALGTEEFHDSREAADGRVRFRYTVSAGDTLGSLADRFGLSVGSLCRINRFTRDHELAPGEAVVVYASREVVPSSILESVDARMADYARD